MDIKESAAKIAEITGATSEAAMKTAKQLEKIHPDLADVVSSWLEGEDSEFEVHGVTLKKIMSSNRCSYLDAVFTMSTILKEPELAAVYKKPRFWS